MRHAWNDATGAGDGVTSTSHPAIRLYSTLTRQIEDFEALRPPQVAMYSCGPTVYRYVHIGNLRTYLMADWLRRTLEASGYHVRHIKNITDVGHMRQDQVDRGEDKMIAAALAEGKTPADIAAFYTDAFLRDEEELGILPAHVFPRATEHVPEMITLIERLLARGHAYVAGGNVYFDVSSFPSYGQLSGNLDDEALLEAVRIEADPLKRGPRDFALWKAAEPGRLAQWESPWGPGFPGWHIECSAMAMRHLGERLDLHTGGVDNIFPHHEDERAQSEAATGLPFARHWVHAQHLLVDNQKMAKSAGNAYTLADIKAHGFDPVDFRYLCLTVGYRSRLNFTWTALRAARQAVTRLRRMVWDQRESAESEVSASRRAAVTEMWRDKFWSASRNNLRLPEALATTWGMLRDPHLRAEDKLTSLREFDGLLGLSLLDSTETWSPADELPDAVRALRERRSQARALHDHEVADALRAELWRAGYEVRDFARET
ncbi:MAG TPA: cysteine--tRNA ligase, partial [Ktedonobacterales bacterium]|nr:cysteine--tRNA ligase [Ktedonobacterales bacterium]